MPLLTRMPKQRVKTQVVCLAPGAVPAAVLRQNGVPVHDVALSRQRFSLGAFGELVQAAKAFRPDVIQAWGHTAQIVANAVAQALRSEVQGGLDASAILRRCRASAGMIDRRKLKYAAKAAPTADRIVYASEAGSVAASPRRLSGRRAADDSAGHRCDALQARSSPRAARSASSCISAPDAFVIGMVAPFQPEYDHATFLKAVGELIKTNPNIAVVLAGHGVQKGNAPLMALVGGGTLGTRTQLLGEWSDLASLFNALRRRVLERAERRRAHDSSSRRCCAACRASLLAWARRAR